MLEKAKALLLSLGMKAPLAAGIVTGYVGHPLIKAVVDVASILIKGLLG